jgi:hypothetical protein
VGMGIGRGMGVKLVLRGWLEYGFGCG